MGLHRITYDGRIESLPCHCEACGKFAGSLAGGLLPSDPMFAEECPGHPQPWMKPLSGAAWPASAKICAALAAAAIFALGASCALLLSQ